FPHLSVIENVRIALQRKRGQSFDFWRSDRMLRSYESNAAELIDAVGLAGFEATQAVELAYGRKRALEIATTLALDPEMMLLDARTHNGAGGPLLAVSGLNAWYGESHVLHGVAFEVLPGEVVTLLGRNGAGKTTTLRSIMGIVPRREGSIRFEQHETSTLPSNRIAR